MKYYKAWLNVIFIALASHSPRDAYSLESVNKFLYHEECRDVAVSDDYLYCAGRLAIHVFAIDYLNNITLENSLDYSNNEDIYIENNHAFVTGAQFRVFDLTDSDSPELVLESPWPFYSSKLKVSNHHAYIRTSVWENYWLQDKIEVLDLSNPLNPIFIGEVVNPGTRNIAEYDVSDSYLCIIWYDWDLPGSDELIIYGISEDGCPYEEMSYSLFYYYEGVDVGIVENYAYVLTGSADIIWDFNSMSVIDTLEIFLPGNIEIMDDWAYTPTGGSITFININDPLNPYLMGRYEEGSGYGPLHLFDDIAYCASTSTADDQPGWNDGLQMIDLEDLYNPAQLGFYNTFDEIGNLKIDGELAYVTANSDGILICDIANPRQPELISQINTEFESLDIFIYGDYAYIADGEGGISIYDINNPCLPFWINGIDTIGVIKSVKIDENIACALGSNTIYVIDISDPFDLEILCAYENLANPVFIEFENNILYVNNDYHNFITLDLSNPYNPQFLGSYQYQQTGYDFDIQNTLGYLSDRPNTLEIIDLSDLSDPTLIGAVAGLGAGVCATASGEYVIAYGYLTGPGGYLLSLIDARIPANPVLIDSVRYGLTGTILSKKGVIIDSLLFVPTTSYVNILRFTPTGIEPVGQLPAAFSLSPNYPNPFNARTTISYSLPVAAPVALDIYDLLGRKVQTLYNGPQPPGEHLLIWNADGFASGIYFYKITAGEYEQTKKMTILK